ncbi:MAG: hypothetical protein AAF442_00015 [Pseudomonadota bacterium]
MPWVTVTGTPIGRLPTFEPQEEKDQPKGERPNVWSETIPAVFKTENTVFSILNYQGPQEDFQTGRYGPRPEPKIDPNFDPLKGLEGTKYEPHAKRFGRARDAEDVAALKRQIDLELERDDVVMRDGWRGQAVMLVAGLLDPINLIPVGGSLNISYRLGRVAWSGAKHAAKTGAISAAASEGLLHASQETRTSQESLVNIGGSIVLSGIIGGSMAPLRQWMEIRQLGKAYDQVKAQPVGAIDDPLVELRPDELEKLIVERGPAFERDGVVTIKGRGYGLVKVITKHGERSKGKPSLQVKKKDVTAFPTILREYDRVPAQHDKAAQINPDSRSFRVKDQQGRTILYAVARHTRGDGQEHLVSIYVEPEPKGPYSKKKTGGGPESPGRIVTPPRDTTAEPSSSSRQGQNHSQPVLNDAAHQASGTPSQKADHLADDPFSKNSPKSQGSLFEESRAMGQQIKRDITPPPLDQPDLLEPGSIKMTADELKADTDTLPPDGHDGSVGAASLYRNNAEEKLKSAFGLEKALRFQDPLLRTATSQSIVTRRIGQELAEQVLRYEKNALGVATPIAVETDIKLWQAPLYQAITAHDDFYMQYRRGRDARFGDITKTTLSDLTGAARREGKLDRQQFAQEIGRAMRRGDTHDIPEVAQAAQAYRRLVFDPLKDRAIQAKLLDEDVDITTATSYLSRSYNTDKIKARRPELGAIIARWLKTQPRHMDMADGEIEDLADEIIDRILGTPDGRLPYDAHLNQPAGITTKREALGSTNARGALAARVFMIPDELIEDFLESDISYLARAYVRSLAPDVELAHRFGKIDMEDQRKDIIRDYNYKAKRAKTEKQRTALEKAKERDLKDIAAMRDRLRGVYAMPQDPDAIHVRAMRVAKNTNYLRLLGGQTLSATPDTARVVMVHGLTRTFRDGIIPLVTGLSKIKAAGKEVKLAGTALDMVLDSRAMAIADVMDNYGRHTKFERGLTAATNHFGLVSAMAPWNSGVKQTAGIVTMARMLETMQAIKAGKKVKAKDAEYLAAAGIDEWMARTIADQFEQFGETIDGVRMANTGAWTDRNAVRHFRAALTKEVDRIIVTPGQDKPLWMSTWWGSTIGQFKSFAVASTQRVLLSGLQQADMATLNGAIMMTGMGMLTYKLKMMAAGYDTADDPRVWVLEGIDRSGMTGWFFEANNMIEKTSRGTVGLGRLAGAPPMSRYASRNTLGAALGPTFGTVGAGLQVASALSSGDWQAQDTRALRRILPYQNIFYLRRLLDQAEKNVNGILGVKQ